MPAASNGRRTSRKLPGTTASASTPLWRTSSRTSRLLTAAAVPLVFTGVVLSRGVANRIGVSYGLAHGSSAVAMTFWPFFVATLLLAPFSLGSQRPAEWRKLALKGAVSVGVCQVLFVLTQQWGSATFASVASALVPVAATALSFRTEPVSRRGALGGVLALSGAIVFALAKSGTASGERPLLAVLAASAALLTATWFYLHNRTAPQTAPPTLRACLARVWPQLASSTVVLAAFGMRGDLTETRLSAWWVHVVVGVLGYAMPLVLSVWMIPRTGVAVSTYTNYAIIPVTALASVAFLGATITPAAWIALGVVIAGLAVSREPNKAERRSTSATQDPGQS